MSAYQRVEVLQKQLNRIKEKLFLFNCDLFSISTDLERLVLDSVCSVFGLPKEALLGKSRVPKVTEARFVLCEFWYRAGSTLEQIGVRLNRNHATIINARRRFSDLCFADPEYRQKVDQVERLVKAHLNSM